MICPTCNAVLDKEKDNGERILRTRGIVIKKHGLALICPKCKGDVPVSPEMMHQLQEIAVLFFRNR